MKTKKFLKQALTLLLTLLMLLSTTSLGLSAAQVDVANTGATAINSGDIIWYTNPNNWSNVNVYLWGGSDGDNGWPGKAMTKESTTGYYYYVSTGNYTSCIFNNGSSQTSDLTIEGPGYLYNGSSWSSFTNDLNNIPATPVSDSDLLAVLKGEKIMFYIGEPSSWGQNTFYLRNGAGGSTVDSGNYVITYSSNRYAVVAASAKTGYYVSHSTSWNGEAINGTPSSGVAYLCNNNDSTSGCATSGSAYSVSASLASNSITAGEKATISSSSKSNGNVGTTTQMMYFVTSDGNVFYELSYSDTALDTSKLNAGTYTIYPAIYDGNVYARGNAITLTVAEEVTEFEYTVTAGEGGSVSPTEGSVKQGESVQLTATADAGYTFEKWTFTGGEGDTSTATTTFTPTADGANAVASFTKNTYTVTASVSDSAGGSVSPTSTTVEYNGSVTFEATVNEGYALTDWKVDGVSQGFTNTSFTLTSIIKNNIKVEAIIEQVPTYKITGVVGSGEGEVTPVNQSIKQTSSIVLSARAEDGYKFSHWDISGTYTVVDGSTNSAEFEITPTSDITATAHFVKVWTVTFKGFDGEVLKTQTEVVDGTAATAPSAPAVDHYTFKEWDADFSNVTSDLTVNAVYTGNTYTVNVSAGTGGTASTTAESVTYHNSVTLTADPDDGYSLVKWNITGAYEIVSGTEKSESFVIIPEENLTITATFAQGRKLTVYTYSADGFNKLTLTEDGTNNVLDAVAQPGTEVFNEVTWNKSDETDISLDATSLTAQLSGEGGGNAEDSSTWYDSTTKKFLTADGYRTIVFRNNWLWSNVCLYAWDASGNANKAWPGVAMTKAYNDGSYDVYVMLVPESYTTFKISGLKNDGSGNRDESPNTALPSDSIKTYEMTWNNANAFSTNVISVSTYTAYAESDSIDLTSTLFKDGAWLGETEVWIYQNGTTEEVTLRRDLLKLIETTTAEYNGGTNSKDYTASSWTAFVDAYETAKSVSGAGASTQAQIDAAEDALQEAYEKLELQAYYTVNVTQNFAGSATVGTNSFNELSKTVNVTQGSTVSLKFVAPTYYYLVSVKINGQVVATQVVTNAWTFEADYTFTSDNNTIEVEYCHNPFLTYKENGVTGGTVDFTGSQVAHHTDGTISVSYGENATLNVTAPDLYYIQSVLVNGQSAYTNTDNDESKTTFTGYVIQSITADTEVIITYAKRSTLKVEILSYPTENGTLYYGTTEIPAEGMTIEVLSGQSVTITAVPAEGYAVQYWVADTVNDSRGETFTFSNITTNHTLDIEWVKVEQITVNAIAKPGTAGTATVNGSASATVDQYTTITLVATVTDGRYKFVNWTIEGGYYLADDTTRNDATFRIVANSNIKATANFEHVNRRIYLKNDANWANCMVHYWGGASGSTYPGIQMTYDSTLGFWYADVPKDTTGLKFNPSTASNKDDNGVEYKNITAAQNLFTNGSSTTGYPTTYVEEGYYLQGNWNGTSHSAYDYIKLEDIGEGLYSYTLNVTSTTDGYIYVNPTTEKSAFWNASTTDALTSPVVLTPGGTYNSHTPVKILIDSTDYGKDYDVIFTFNPTTGDFSWTISEHLPTVSIIGTDGRGKNQTDANMETANDRVGDTYFDRTTVKVVNEHTYYAEAQANVGSAVTFFTQVNKNGSGGYDYYVAGWVINGTEFVSATSVGNGLYRGAYVFNGDATVVPVYFHTNEWLTANNVSTVTVYAVADKDIATWDKYFAAYTWYKVGGVTQYEQFGAWSGQLMIPVAGLDGVYYTLVETATNEGVQISGITFNNYPSGDTIDNSALVDYTNIQTYDYYEFISLLNDKKDNITFVIKDTNDTYNSTRVSTSTIDVTANGNWDFVQYTDYSGLKTDIFGNNIESIDSKLLDSDALYIVQAGDKNVSDGTLDGQWYVECYLYDATGKYLGKCYSYELHDEDSTIWTSLEAYKNQRAYISYEHVNGARYDGEWYGDAQNVTVTINLAVKVALMGDDGKYEIDTEGELNLADYGNAYINGVQNVDVTRGTTVSLSAIPVTGYKFVGWYTADGTLFDKNLNSSAMAAIGTYYVAVFEPLAEGLFYVNHYIYSGISADYYTPIVHGGNAQLYVGIQNVTQGTTTTLLLGNSAGLAATEGDKLLITIATDGIGADKFYAWYTDAFDKNGNPNFEEVGVDSLDNLAFSNPDCPYYMGVSTVVGSIDRVYFQFEYIVGGDEDEFVLNFYSDLQPVSDKITLVYQYTDRYGNAKQYVVPYTLTDDEIKGFAGNNYEEFTPAYISSTDGSWVNTILANAPYVEDYFKDTTWKINSAMFDTMTFLLWATQPETMYTVTTTVVTKDGADVLVNSVPYNTVLDLDIRDLVLDASYTGFWYQDVNNNGTYEKAVDIMLTYGPYYGYRVTQDMAVNYQYVDSADDYEFNVSLDAPVYGREQTTDSSGNNKTDIVIIDYVINILTPYFYISHPEFTPIYDGKEITDADWNKTLVTIESLKDAGYNVEYGVILEQVGTFDIKNGYAGDFAEAEKAAALKGYGTATDEELLKNFINSGSAKGWINGQNSTYGYKYDASGLEITNKNRVLFVLEHNNTEKNQNRFYNVYSYLTVTTPDNVTTTYISNVQTLNIYEEGIKDAVVENNTSFA